MNIYDESISTVYNERNKKDNPQQYSHLSENRPRKDNTRYDKITIQ